MPAVSPRRSWRFWIVYLTIVTMVVAGVLDVAAGIVMRQRVSTMLSIFQCILCDDRNVLTPRPGLVQTWNGGTAFSVTVRTNARGFREDVEFADADVDVAFMGDSFAFGWGVEADERFSAVVAAALPDRRVVSLSYNNGFQPEHYEYFLTRHPDLRPRVVVVMLCLGNDLDSDLKETVITRRADGTLEDLRLPYRGLYFGAMRSAAVYRPWPLGALVTHTNMGTVIGAAINQSPGLRQRLTAPDVVLVNTVNPIDLERGQLTPLSDRTFDALSSIAAHVASWGGQVQVALIPQDVYLGAPPSAVLRQAYGEAADELVGARGLVTAVLDRCRERGLSCKDLTPALTRDDYIPGDGHWTPMGHVKVARALEPGIRRMLESAQ